MTPVDDVLAQLKDFQRTTARHAFRRMYGLSDPATRFLIADEVGLGKTLVARGVIAQTIEHLQQLGTQRIDIVYICSNAEIARQNIARLRVGAGITDVSLPDRITMLPLHRRRLDHDGINFFSFTPGTSFDLKGREGTARERAMLALMLQQLWGASVVQTKHVARVLQGGVQKVSRFLATMRDISDAMGGSAPPDLVRRLGEEIARADERDAARPPLKQRYLQMAEEQSWLGKWPAPWGEERRNFVSVGRRVLAQACVDDLQPDLVILDEFQRFTGLLDGTDAASALANALFAFVDPDTNEPARVLLLSATPYKMFTTAQEAMDQRTGGSDGDDHYGGFARTVDFLLEGLGNPPGNFGSALRRYRLALFDAAHDDGAAARRESKAVEAILRRVMCRTERLAVTPNRDGMLTTRDLGALPVHEADFRAYMATDAMARAFDVRDPVDLWKSAPYLPNFMDKYRLDQELDRHLASPSGLGVLTQHVAATSLPLERLRSYDEVDDANPRLRALTADVVESGLWRLLWMPPARPYYAPGGAYAALTDAQPTKRLVFSAWHVVPRAVATLLSYRVEQKIMARTWPGARNTPDGRRQRVRLGLSRSYDRLTGMPVVALLYPSATLAAVGDPLGFARAGVSDLMAVRHAVGERIAAALSGLPDPIVPGQPPDEHWYWAAPLLLDAAANRDSTLAMLRSRMAWEGDGTGSDTGDLFQEHLNLAAQMVREGGSSLGPRPADLIDVLASLAIGGLANCALRAVSRVAPGASLADMALRARAASAAWGLRALFNGIDTSELVRGEYPNAGAYWRQVLQYAVDGNLQAVLDEFAHLIPDMVGALRSEPDEAIAAVADTIRHTAMLRTARTEFRGLTFGDDGTVDVTRERMRNHFAMRLADEKSSDGEVTTRAADVRRAFNSPFWPFVLVSTSVGQEGLDFHTYCHAVVHWNLPHNPVDLEQREGRVHRYKGHAVRKNVALLYGDLTSTPTADPWQAMFDAGVVARRPDETDLVPFWVQPAEGGASIERIVLAPPLSREVGKVLHLQQTLALYRLAFGQPRQEEDLIAYFQTTMEGDALEALARDLRMDLSPPVPV